MFPPGSPPAGTRRPLQSSNSTTALVFARLDPILRNLLEGLTSLKDLLPSLSVHDEISNDNTAIEATFVRLVQNIASLLESLSRNLRWHEPSEWLEKEAHAKSLCLLSDYITLPLTAIFHLSLKEIYTTTATATVTATHQRKLQIRRSYIYKLYFLAATAIRTYTEQTSVPITNATATTTMTMGLSVDHETNIERSVHAQAANHLLPSHTRIKYLIALVHSMPSFSDLSEDISAEGLDDGSDAWVAILDAARDLVASFSDSDPSRQQLLEAWHGTLLMRLVDCLTAFLENRRHENNTQQSNTNKTSRPVFSQRVQCTAIETLWVLLTVTTIGSEIEPPSDPFSPEVTFWRSVFPGVFAALYQRLMEDPRGTGDSNLPIQSLSLDSLIILLRTTLQDTKNNKEDTSSAEPPQNSNDDVLARLTSMVAEANLQNSGAEKRTTLQPNSASSPTETQKDHLFVKQVKQRVEGPLLVLLQRLSISSSDRIRQRVVVLCRVILVETQSAWAVPSTSFIPIINSKNDQTSKAIASTSSSPSSSKRPQSFSALAMMERTPLEICIRFQQDPDTIVRNSASQIIENFDHRITNDEQIPSITSSLSLWMVPRVLELVEQLAALVHKENRNNQDDTRANGIVTASKLRTELNLIAGYLQCLESHATKKKDSKQTTATSDGSMCSALLSSKQLQRGLIQLFDVDLESPLKIGKYRNVVSIVDETSNANKESSLVKLRYLDHPDLESVANDFILRSLGRLLGPKHGALFVDAVISDFMEATVHMPNASKSHHRLNTYDSLSSPPLATDTDTNVYSCWLHEWLGSLVVAREVLLGSFLTTPTTEGQQHSKKGKRRSRILEALASSVLPLLVDSFLWNLPIDNADVVTNRTATNGRTTDTFSQHRLQKNTTVVVLLLELIGAFSQVLETDMKNFLTIVLYPIVDRISCNSPGRKTGIISTTETIQIAGTSVLEMICISCGFQSVNDLIYTEQNQLIAVMVGRLRLPGGSKLPRNFGEAQETLIVTRTFRWMMKQINEQIVINNKASTNQIPIASKSVILDLVFLLEHRLDYLFLQKVLMDSDVEGVCSLHKAVYEYFLHLFKVDTTISYSFGINETQKTDPIAAQHPWLAALSPFVKGPRNTMEEDDSNTKADETTEKCLAISKSDVTLFSRLISRGCYMLSYHTLGTRISSCDTLTIGFRFLAFVGSQHYDPNDENNLIRNSVLRQVADSWPSIRARLKSLSNEVLASSYKDKLSSAILVMSQNNAQTLGRSTKPVDIGIQRIFLAKLFELIGTMCECSGDFFADRFRHDVWPTMASHLESTLKELERQRAAPCDLVSKSNLKQPHPVQDSHSQVSVALSATARASFKMSDTESQLLKSILMSLNRILEQKECGKAVEKMLSSVGFTLLPLLDLEGHAGIQELTMDCIRNILRIDCDVLRRPLMDLGRTEIPPSPLRFGKRETSINRRVSPLLLATEHTASPYDSPGNKTIVNCCNELLTFANTLPEQAIW